MTNYLLIHRDNCATIFSRVARATRYDSRQTGLVPVFSFFLSSFTPYLAAFGRLFYVRNKRRIDMDATQVGELLAYLASAGFFAWLVKAGKAFLQKWRYVRGFGHQREAELTMKSMLEHGADQVLLFSGQNCGGMPAVGKPYTVSCLIGVGSGVNREMVKDYKDLPVDGHYMGLLQEVGLDGSLSICAQSLPDSQIKNYYEIEGVKHSIWAFVGLIDMRFVFVSISRHENSPFSEHEKTMLMLKVNRLRRLMR